MRIDRNHLAPPDEELANPWYEAREETGRAYAVLHHDSALAIQNEPNELPHASAARTLHAETDEFIVTEVHTSETLTSKL